ncbi:MAG TPA: energy transducer TonB [Gemmatimonadaceae bacterium]
MLDTLLESKSKRERSAAGAIVSVLGHTALIAGAVYATAQARVQPIGSPETVRPIYFPQTQNPISTAPVMAVRQQPIATSHRLIFVDPHVDIQVPIMDVGDIASRPDDFSPGPITEGPKGSGKSGAGPTDTEYRADQVDKQVAVVPGGVSPRYPESLRSSGVEGRVIAEFVVDEQGRAQEGSVRFVRSDNQLFGDAVRVALRRMRFVPAEVGGRKVKQLVQMPFVFTLSR